MTRHEYFMRQALELACMAFGRTAPNPMVGAVLVRGGKIVGKGWHRRVGLPHAEVEALKQAGASVRGATLYVTLEPCNHFGRTPPCCDAILSAGIRRVVVAMRDPNPITNGRGLARLRKAGVSVIEGVLAKDARELNRAFVKVMTRGLPWVMLKLAQSLDGKIATPTGDSRWITGLRARRQVHALRSSADAVVVGINTILQDNPRLSARGRGSRLTRPAKVILDSRLRTPPSAKCLSKASPAATIIATVSRLSQRRRKLQACGAEVWVFSPDRQRRVPMRKLFRRLAAHGFHSVLIEGGGEVAAAALKECLVDYMIVYIAPLVLGGRNAVPSVAGSGVGRLSLGVRLKDVETARVGDDWRIAGKPVYPGEARGR